jgi:type VI secretion system protein ImpH
MAAADGPEDSHLTASESSLEATALGAALACNANSFDFFQAVALLEGLLSERSAVGGFSSPGDEAVHFRAQARLAFPASEIHQLVERKGAPPEMTVNFMGLTGPMGVLPQTYSELIIERLRAKDTGLAAFLDIFNHRAVSLFYRAWKRSRPALSYGDAARDRLTQYLLDLLGLGTTGLRDRQEAEDEALIHYLSLTAMHARSAVALEQIVGDYFEVPVAVEQFTGAWYGLEEVAQCAIGGQENVSRQLGLGAVAGDAIWDRQSRVRLRIGPLTKKRYDGFLPGGSANRQLRAITRFFTNDCLDFEVQLVLRREEAPAIRLGLDERQPARLGWDSWASTAPMNRDPDETILLM